MSIEKFYVRDVTVLTGTPDSEYGGDVLIWDSPTIRATKGWLHRLSETEEVAATRDANISAWVLRLPKDDPITSANRVQIDGETFEVDGPPNRAWTPRGQHHVRCSLRQVVG